MTTLQDILGLIKNRKIKTPSDKDYIISAAYTNKKESLKTQPEMQTNLLSIGAIKKYIIDSLPPSLGGQANLQEVTDEGNSTTTNIQFLDNAKVLFDNGSRLQKGTTNAYTGGNGGISQICSIDYELKWEAGRQYVLHQDGFTIREVKYNFTITPGIYDDYTKGFVVGSRWILDNGDVYVCTDNTTEDAAWKQIAPKYKVFTALLSQDGVADSTKTVGNSDGGPLKQVTTFSKGATYVIDENPNNTDLSALGAPNSLVGTRFISTLDADLVAYGLDVDVVFSFNQAGIRAQVLDNTIGDVWFTYEGIGVYALRSDNLFTLEKTTTFNSTFYNFATESIVTLSTPSWETNTDGMIKLTAASMGNGPLGLNDGLMGTPVLLEVRVYN